MKFLLLTPPDILVKFEDIFEGDKKGCFKILSKLEGIEYNNEEINESLIKKINRNKVDFFPKYSEWPNKWKEQFLEIAGKTMEYFGYKE